MSHIYAIMVFLCFSMESETFVGTSVFYGFKNFRILGLNVAVWLLIPLFVSFVIHNRKLFWYANRTQRKIIKKLLLFSAFSLMMGIFNYAINDNGFAAASGSLAKFGEELYSYGLPLIELCIGI